MVVSARTISNGMNTKLLQTKFAVSLSVLTLALSAGGFALAADQVPPEVAGAGPTYSVTPTPSPTPTPTPTPIVSSTPTPSVSVSVAPEPAATTGGWWEQLMGLGNMLWYILGAVALIIIGAYYLMRRNKSQTPPPLQ